MNRLPDLPANDLCMTCGSLAYPLLHFFAVRTNLVKEARMAKRILVVEDSDDARYLLVTILQRFGYETIEAATGTQAVEGAIAGNPDLIFMDLGLPKLNGLGATRAIRQNPTMVHVPIVAYTAWDANQYYQEAIDAGMVAYLEKPAPRDLIKRTIEQFVRTDGRQGV
jgi:CheY-like chemotaxis protein